MKLNINFAILDQLVEKYGDKNEFLTVELIPQDPPDFPNTIEEVDIVDVKPHPVSGVLTYKGRHIILFIPDHSHTEFEQVKNNPKDKGKKFHLVDCKTLKDMKEDGRFYRYTVTTSRTGFFHIYANDDDGEVRLNVCKYCLDKLNYKGYSRLPPSSSGSPLRDNAVAQFNLEEFFEMYRSYFSKIPEDVGQTKSGYSEDWENISFNYRLSKNFCCENCGINLNEYRQLLHVHYKNGVKQDNKIENLKAVCIECHAKEPHHSHLIVRDEDKALLKKLRFNQMLLLLS